MGLVQKYQSCQMEISITRNKTSNNKNMFVFVKERKIYINIYLFVKIREKVEESSYFR